ncbi:MAG TPA: PIN domain-containing protein [Arachnia sp.]|jgi:toxin-antitoxin system PIN domain toxin|nr:PIN domain-containing protein [Arachnia sp.]
MIVPDLNLLMYAHVDAYPQHTTARQWWERTLSGNEEIGLVAPVVFGFVRLATGRRVLVTPMTTPEATATVESWFGQPNLRLLPDSPRSVRETLRLLDAVGAAGNLTTDAQIAAHALEQDAVVATNDADFARFPGVRTVNPLRV